MNEDFVSVLREFGRPPFTSIREPLQCFKTLQDLCKSVNNEKPEAGEAQKIAELSRKVDEAQKAEAKAQQEIKRLLKEEKAAKEAQKEIVVLRKAAEKAEQEIKFLRLEAEAA